MAHLSKTKVTSTEQALALATNDNVIILEQKYTLGRFASINQCELFAIKQACEWIINLSVTNANIHIFSDSQTTLHKLNKNSTNSKLTSETNLLLNKICETNNNQLLKVPAHKGIEGNEKADALAKKGTVVLPIGPEPFIGFTMNNIINDINSILNKKQINKIKSQNIMEERKTPLISYLLKMKYGNRLTITDKNKLRIFTQMLSGQNHLANNHSKRDVTVVPFCRHCTAEKETAEHLIAKCPAYSLKRMQSFGTAISTMNDLIIKHKPSDIVKFVNETGRLDEKYVCYYID